MVLVLYNLAALCLIIAFFVFAISPETTLALVISAISFGAFGAMLYAVQDIRDTLRRQTEFVRDMRDFLRPPPANNNEEKP